MVTHNFPVFAPESVMMDGSERELEIWFSGSTKIAGFSLFETPQCGYCVIFGNIYWIQFEIFPLALSLLL